MLMVDPPKNVFGFKGDTVCAGGISCAHLSSMGGSAAREPVEQASAKVNASVVLVATRLVTSERTDVLRQHALGALHQLEGDAAALLERPVAFRLDGREMGEHVRPSAFGLDEAEALGVVEPFHGTESHFLLQSQGVSSSARGTGFFWGPPASSTVVPRTQLP